MARFYVNRLARFSSPDPLAGSPIDPQSLNRYTYAHNSPTNLTDPTGLCIAPLLDENGNEQACYDGVLWGNTGGDPWGLPPEIAQEEARHISIITIGYDPEFPNKNGLEDRFNMCVSEYGDENAKAHLTLEGYLAAQSAAASAGIDTAEELALWENENSLLADNTVWGGNVWEPGPHGEIGPIQILPGPVGTLRNLNRLPNGWNSDLQANLLAGARYYAWILGLRNPAVPRSEAAAAYNGGTAWRGSRKKGTLHRVYKDKPAARAYQEAFNKHQEAFSRLDECMKTGK